jgi:hypothetical protein
MALSRLLPTAGPRKIEAMTQLGHQSLVVAPVGLELLTLGWNV